MKPIVAFDNRLEVIDLKREIALNELAEKILDLEKKGFIMCYNCDLSLAEDGATVRMEIEIPFSMYGFLQEELFEH